MIERATIYWLFISAILATVICFSGCVSTSTKAETIAAKQKIEQLEQITTEAVTKFVPTPAKEIANAGISLVASIASLIVGAGAYTHSRRTRSRSGGNRNAGSVGKLL